MYDLWKLPAGDGENQIRPLNLTEEEDYMDHFKSQIPPKITVCAALLPLLPAHMDHAFELVDDAQNALSTAVSAVGNSSLTDTISEVYPGFLNLFASLTPAQKAWVFNGIYLQISFFDETMVDASMDPHRRLAFAETWMDCWISRSGSIEPRSHPAITVQDDQHTMDLRAQIPKERDDLAAQFEDWSETTRNALTRGYRLTIGDLYRERVGLHIRALINARNEILIRVRAALMGKDPNVAWADFVNAGHRYFLDGARP